VSNKVSDGSRSTYESIDSSEGSEKRVRGEKRENGESIESAVREIEQREQSNQ
jgi:hypothetical protein